MLSVFVPPSLDACRHIDERMAEDIKCEVEEEQKKRAKHDAILSEFKERQLENLAVGTACLAQPANREVLMLKEVEGESGRAELGNGRNGNEEQRESFKSGVPSSSSASFSACSAVSLS